MLQISKQRGSFLRLLLFVFLFVVILNGLWSPQEVLAAQTPTEQIKDGVFGDRLSDDDGPGYLERQIAKITIRTTEFILDVLGLKDYNELIFQVNANSLIFNTFEAELFSVITGFFNSFLRVSGWLCVFALFFWAFTIMFRGGSQLGQSSISEMSRGILVYFLGLYLGGYMFDLVFFGNRLIVLWSIDGLKEVTGWNVNEFSILEVVSMETTNFAHSILVFVVVLCVGMLNYQYAVRLVTLMFLIIIFPLVLYAGMYPGNQKALDTWFKEFLSQVYTQGGHALGYAIFVALLAKQPSFWILFAFLISMPTITSLIRLLFGAPGGGTIGGGMGIGSLMAMNTMMRGVKGSGVFNGNGPVTAGAPSSAGNAPIQKNPMAAMFGKLGSATTAVAAGRNPMGNFFKNGGGGFQGTGGKSASFADFAKANGGKAAVAKKAGYMAMGAVGRGSADLAKRGVVGAIKHTPKAVGMGTGFIAGTALTGSVGGGFVGATMGGKAGELASKGVLSVGKGMYEAGKAYSNFRKDNPVQETRLKQPPLALPMGSSKPMLALPSGNEQFGGGTPPKLPGDVHTPLADKSGVMVSHSHKPVYPSTPNPGSVGQMGAKTPNGRTQSVGQQTGVRQATGGRNSGYGGPQAPRPQSSARAQPQYRGKPGGGSSGSMGSQPPGGGYRGGQGNNGTQSSSNNRATPNGPSAPPRGFSGHSPNTQSSRPKPVVIDVKPMKVNGATVYKA
ncbi:hypothetical protein ASF12_23480 [Paenibacillus sp. Leaf72]|nr:hypothetical protein ASF12_23480 [Paenibacillus sp. Leaf72]